MSCNFCGYIMMETAAQRGDFLPEGRQRGLLYKHIGVRVSWTALNIQLKGEKEILSEEKSA